MENEGSEDVVLAGLREVGNNSPDAVMIIDRVKKKVTFSNDAAYRLLGISSGDTQRKIEGLIEMVVAADRAFVMTKYRRIKDQPASTGLEFRLNDTPNTFVWLSCSVYLVQEKRFVYVVAQDITRSKKHEDYLVEYGAKKNALLDTLVHQLNGSLSLMNNLAARAKKLNVVSDQSQLDEFIALMLSNSEHCVAIIDDLLREEHSESTGIHAKFARVDLVKLVNYIFEEFKKGNSRKMVFETTAPVILATTDDFKLLQVINNLASNSLKFTREHDEIRFAITETDSTVLITISDSGIGIPDSIRPFIFEKHGPARRTGLNGEKSIGLGLSICKNLVNLLGGRLWFESQEGKGSSFFVELPKEQ